MIWSKNHEEQSPGTHPVRTAYRVGIGNLHPAHIRKDLRTPPGLWNAGRCYGGPYSTNNGENPPPLS